MLKSAEKAYALYMCELGNCYLAGTGVSQNEHEGLKWLKKLLTLVLCR